MVLASIRIGLGVGWATLAAAGLTGVRSSYGLGLIIMTAREPVRADAIITGRDALSLVGY